MKHLTERNSNLELLRIFSMFLIVTHHFAIHSGLPLWNFSSSNALNLIWSQWLCLGGKLGVDLFVLISGYFLATKTGGARFTSILRLLIVTAMYGGGIYIVFSLSSDSLTFNLKDLIKSCMPANYWFIACYLALIFLSPFLSLTLQKLNKNQYGSLCTLLFLMISTDILPGADYFKSPLLTFISLFVFAGYIKIHLILNNIKARLLISVVCLNIVFFIYWLLHVDFISTGNFFKYGDINSVPILMLAISIFLLFIKLNIGHIVWINRVASCTLGVYLFHDNNLIRPWLWQTLLHVSSHITSQLFIIYSLVIITTVYIICSLIEYSRHFLFNPLIQKLLDRFIFLDKQFSTFFRTAQ